MVHRFEYRFHLIVEAHIEHMVALVEDDALYVFRFQRAAAQMVENTPRRADDHGSAVAQRAYLALHIKAADKRRDAHPEIGSEPCELPGRLLGEFAGR